MEDLLRCILDGSLPVNEVSIKLRNTASKAPKNVVLDQELIKRAILFLANTSPCLDEALLLLTSLLCHSGISNVPEALQALNLDVNTSGEAVEWIRLGLCRSFYSKRQFSSDILDLARDWNFFSPESTSISVAKHSLFKARFIEMLTKALVNTPVLPPMGESFCSWAIESLFSSDDLTLQKAKELVVTILTKSPVGCSLFNEIIRLNSDMKIKYQVLCLLLNAKAKGKQTESWAFDSEFMREAKEKASLDRGLAPSICDLFVAMMTSNCAKIAGIENESLLMYLLKIDEEFKPQLAKYLLPRIISSCPQLVKNLETTYKVIPQNHASLETYILILLSVSAAFGGLAEDSINLGFLRDALISSHDEIRLGAFGCICRSFGPTRKAKAESFALLDLFIRHLLLDSTANLRQKALVSVQALFCSLFARIYSLVRLKKRQEDFEEKNEQYFEQSNELDMLQNWLKNLLSMMLNYLGDSHRHQFSCTDLALKTILEFGKAIDVRNKTKTLRELTCIDTEVDVFIGLIVQDTIGAQKDALISCILDNTFDSNRQMAKDIVMQFSLIASSQRSNLLEDALGRLLSPREALADGASLMILLLSNDDLESINTYTNLLKGQIEATKENIAQAAAENNLNGTLCLLTHLIKRSTKLDQALIREIQALAIEVGQVVSALASQPSPEGSDLGQFLDNTGTIPSTQTSQLVLTFCWRAIKESTNILGLLASYGSSDELIKVTMDHMVELLLSLRHPGAFCAIEDPLKMVATAMFNSDDQEIRAYPKFVLEKSVTDCLLQPEIQVTRRSAGLPICLSSILTAAALSKETIYIDTGSLINIPARTMLELINGLDLEDPNPSPSIVHALNILRSFFRNANLDALTGPFVTESFEACFKSFNSSSWSVCNGAMMLFGSLVRRTFGSASSKDPGEDMESQIDLRQLAAKFPDLLPCFETQLTITRNSASHIYPLLSVLQRMRFSSGAIATYSTVFEATFKFLVETCFGHEVGKIRMMSSRLMLKSLLVGCPELVWPKLKSFVMSISKKCSANELSTKLQLLVKLSASKEYNLLQDISCFSSTLERFWRAECLPAAIRWPSLVLWKRCTQKQAKLEDFLGNFRVEPYQFEFCSEIVSNLDSKSATKFVDRLEWKCLRSRLISENSVDPTIYLGTAATAFKSSGDSYSVETRLESTYHFGEKTALLNESHRTLSLTCINGLLDHHPKNPDIILHCLKALIKQGYEEVFAETARNYLELDNKYSDVVREAVVHSLPGSWDNFTLSVFQVLRMALVDDDEDLRSKAALNVQLLLGLAEISLPATLEALHKHCHGLMPKEYLTWRSEVLLKVSKIATDEGFVLFAQEPYNLFSTPSWEATII